MIRYGEADLDYDAMIIFAVLRSRGGPRLSTHSSDASALWRRKMSRRSVDAGLLRTPSARDAESGSSEAPRSVVEVIAPAASAASMGEAPMARAVIRTRVGSSVEEQASSAGSARTAVSPVAFAVVGSSLGGPMRAGVTECAPSLNSSVRGGPLVSRRKGRRRRRLCNSARWVFGCGSSSVVFRCSTYRWCHSLTVDIRWLCRHSAAATIWSLRAKNNGPRASGVSRVTCVSLPSKMRSISRRVTRRT